MRVRGTRSQTPRVYLSSVMRGNVRQRKVLIIIWAVHVWKHQTVKTARLSYLKFASQDLRKNFGQAPPPNCCIQNLLKKENKTICEASGLMAIQVQGDENELPLPDGVDGFPWHLLLAKCFIKQTHDLKDLCKCGVSTEKKNGKEKKIHTCKKINSVLI